MRTIASRTLAASPEQVWAALEREGALVVTKDGVPRSIMVPTSDATLVEDIQEIVFARARKRSARFGRAPPRPAPPT